MNIRFIIPPVVACVDAVQVHDLQEVPSNMRDLLRAEGPKSLPTASSKPTNHSGRLLGGAATAGAVGHAAAHASTVLADARRR